MFKSALTKKLFIDSLQDTQRIEFEANSSLIKLPKGQLLFTENGTPFGCYVMESGKAKLYKTGVHGKRQIFQICNEGDLFGYHPVLTNSKYPDGAELLENSELLFIPADLFRKLVKTNLDLANAMLNALCTEFERFIGQGTMLAHKSVYERVCTVLFFLSVIYKSEDSICIPLNRSDLSDLCGTVKETLVRTLHELKEERIIEIIDSKGTISIKNIEALKKNGKISDLGYS